MAKSIHTEKFISYFKLICVTQDRADTGSQFIEAKMSINAVEKVKQMFKFSS